MSEIWKSTVPDKTVIVSKAELERLQAVIEAGQKVVKVVQAWADYDTDPESDEYLDICDDVVVKTKALADALAKVEGKGE